MSKTRLDNDMTIAFHRRGGQWTTVEIHCEAELTDSVHAMREPDPREYAIADLPVALRTKLADIKNELVAHRDQVDPID